MLNKKMTILGIFSLLCLFPGSPLPAAGDTKGPGGLLMGSQPIKITSDRLEAFGDKRLVVFSGNAVAVQGDKIIRADRLSLYYKKETSGVKTGDPGGIEGAGELERIEAKGRVRITHGKRQVTGDEAVYEQDTQIITMTGNAVMREEGNVVRGDKITVLLNENRGVVEGQPNRRVSATIFPSEGLDKKGK
ncbi:MAG: hypothetical protein N2Z74_04145 [Syntrophales bacterium]|nr:hypothetical protein [Syntrophales bacterium]